MKTISVINEKGNVKQMRTICKELGYPAKRTWRNHEAELELKDIYVTAKMFFNWSNDPTRIIFDYKDNDAFIKRAYELKDGKIVKSKIIPLIEEIIAFAKKNDRKIMREYKKENEKTEAIKNFLTTHNLSHIGYIADFNIKMPKKSIIFTYKLKVTFNQAKRIQKIIDEQI